WRRHCIKRATFTAEKGSKQSIRISTITTQLATYSSLHFHSFPTRKPLSGPTSLLNMKYNAALLALAASMASVRAAPAQESPPAAFTPSDPFVACVQKTFPKFPREGDPTQEQLQACFPRTHPQAARELVTRNANDDLDSTMQPRDFTDNIKVLGELMGLDQKSKCQDEVGVPTKLHDEFVWIEDVQNAAHDLCNDALKTIETYGLKEDGGVGWAWRQFSNGHDEQSNYLHNSRHLLLTMGIRFFPPAALAQEQIKDVAKGIRDLCANGVSRLMDPTVGCTSEVGWYVSQKARFDKHLAAVGGQLGIFFNGTNQAVGSIELGFSEDSN
ncbi:hypothetical protein K458DRAFT_206397, partial [Lentithecium fluviatile CBS 122367]